MQNLKEGQKVSINDDNWETLNLVGEVIAVGAQSVTVITEDGVTRTLSKNQVNPLSYLTEIENDGKNLL